MKTKATVHSAGIMLTTAALSLFLAAVPCAHGESERLAPAQPTEPAEKQAPSPAAKAAANQYAQEALQLLQAGRLAEAETRLRLALHKDPRCSVALALMPRLQQKKEQAAGREVREKLKAMIVEEVNFSNAPLSSVIDFIADESQKLSPDGKGVNLILKASEDGETKPIHLKLRKVPLFDVLKYTCELADLEMRFEKFAIILSPVPPPAPKAPANP